MPFDHDALEVLAATREVRIETRHPDGPVHSAIIWVVVDGGDVFVRSWLGERARWYREAVANPAVTIVAGDRRLPAVAAHAIDPDSVLSLLGRVPDQVPEVEIGPEHGRREHPRHDPASRTVLGDGRQRRAFDSYGARRHPVPRPGTVRSAHGGSTRNHRGVFMSRHHLLRLTLAASVIAVVAACAGSAPAAPALTDPEEILTQSVASLKDVSTVEVTGGLTGSVNAEGMGSFDLSNSTISAALDVPGKKGEFHFSAPTLLNSTLDAILLEDAAYYKVGGALAMLAGGASDKWIKSEIPKETGEPVTDPEEVDKAIDEFEAALDKLPNPPTKEADEKCGDQDCYHIKIEKRRPKSSANSARKRKRSEMAT